MRIFTNLLLVLMLFWSIESKATCTPLTVSMASGGAGANATAFTNDGVLGSTSGATYYLHWDNTYLYLGWSGGNTVYSSDMYYAALDLRSGGSSGSIQGVGFSNAIMDYYVVYENNAGFYGAPVSNGDAYEVYQASGSSSWGFVSRDTGNDGTNGRVTFGNDAASEIRVRIPWSTFGGMPSSFKVVFWCNNSSGNYIWSSYPSSNPWGTSTPATLTDGIRFATTGSGTCPANDQFAETLPVSWQSFTATPRPTANLLAWATATERNNSHFEVERSADSRSWAAIGRVAGVGDSQQEQRYTFADAEPLPGRNYYRLRQVDFDGQFDYSGIVLAERPDKGGLRVFPNPAASAELRLSWPADWFAEELQLYAPDGRLARRWALAADQTEQPLAEALLPAGIYLARLVRGQGQELAVTKVWVQ